MAHPRGRGLADGGIRLEEGLGVAYVLNRS